MGKNKSASGLTNFVQYDNQGNIFFVSGSNTLMSISSSGAITTTGNITGSSAVTALTASSVLPLNQNVQVTGSLNVSNTITATTLVVSTVSSSVVFSSGSNIFGNTLTNTQQLTGSVTVTGSFAVATTGTELQVTNTGVRLGNATADVHSITGSLSVNPSGLFVSSSGNVGIGTSTPVIDLQIGNKTIVQNVVNAQSSYSNNVFYNGTNWFLKDAGTGTAVRLNSPDSLGDISFHTIISGSAGANVGTEMDTTGVKMIIKNNGNIGIRTTTVVEGTQAAGSISIFPSSSVSSAPLIQFPGNGRIRPASTGDRLSIDGNSLFLNSTFSGNVIMATGGGRVGVGAATPSSTLGVRSAGADGIVLEQDSSNAINSTRLFFSGSNQTFALFNNDGDWRFTYGAQPGNTSGTSLARFTNTGKYFRMEGGTGGIQFQGATAATSALNYYEEGNWTPQLAWSAGGNYVMGGINSGRYVRVGSMVHLQFQLNWSSLSGSSGGTLRVIGVPFTAGGTSRSAGSICANNSIGLNSGYTWLGLTIDPGASFIYIIENASAGGYSHNPIVQSSGIVYSLQITYSIN